MNDRLPIICKRYICELCGGRYAAAGDCATCEGVRLRDLADPGVRSWIDAQDASRRNQRLRTLLMLAPLLALPTPFLLPMLFGPLPVRSEIAWALSAVLIGILLVQLFPAPRLAPRLSDAEERWLRSLRVPRSMRPSRPV